MSGSPEPPVNSRTMNKVEIGVFATLAQKPAMPTVVVVLLSAIDVLPLTFWACCSGPRCVARLNGCRAGPG